MGLMVTLQVAAPVVVAVHLILEEVEIPHQHHHLKEVMVELVRILVVPTGVRVVVEVLQLLAELVVAQI